MLSVLPRMKETSINQRNQKLLLLSELEGMIYSISKIYPILTLFFSINKVSPKVKKILQLLRLRQLHNGVFVRLTKPILNMLHIVEPYIAYGYPNLKTVRELIYKRGYAKINGQRIPLTDNSIIEKHLGKHGIVCMEDLVHEIYTSGPKFREVSRFLWPFKLSSPRGGFINKLHGYTDGGDSGDREEAINALIRRMN